ncbi:hypothetical protein FH972_014350 [Carpinus fangiana]|uniref:RNase H type-1 domain-containing protein n=1 Tax=Carpinus fangiana TaxID=176857 RepID=A0A5N6RBC1_9ROSI|nr:hypothetical protein FH972_014350 [Carpinus fangiana]
MRITRIQFEGDAKNVIKAMKADSSDDCGWRQITEDILFSLQSIPQWEMGYSRCDTNKVAHRKEERRASGNLKLGVFETTLA